MLVPCLLSRKGHCAPWNQAWSIIRLGAAGDWPALVIPGQLGDTQRRAAAVIRVVSVENVVSTEIAEDHRVVTWPTKTGRGAHDLRAAAVEQGRAGAVHVRPEHRGRAT